MFLVPNLYAKNLSAPDDAKSPYETWFVDESQSTRILRAEKSYGARLEKNP